MKFYKARNVESKIRLVLFIAKKIRTGTAYHRPVQIVGWSYSRANVRQINL